MLCLLYFASPWKDDPKPVVITRTEVKEVKVPQPFVVEREVAAPATPPVLPAACARLLEVATELDKQARSSSRQSSKLPDLVDKIGVHLVDRDVPAIQVDSGALRALKQSLDTSNIKVIEQLKALTSALDECRQETAP